MTGLQMFGGLLMGGSLIGTFQVAALVLRRRAAHQNPVAATAKVIRLDRSSTEGDLEDWFIPTVEYQSEDGEVHQSKLGIVKASVAPKVGKTVQIIYERGNPKNCLEPKTSSSDSTALYLALCGLMLVFAIGTGLSFEKIRLEPAGQEERRNAPESNPAK